ncbi:hypothetical protein BDM02DRAFT_2074614 [Thelephora ganbajun]|uniref:Uncharacterized protein n=1 Tax=Thelephora ganbajun TaxID=370292 RepID=A0ACB6ZH80_THEGA|nr:hypothetical protein BDM02DRAFT_2074614 [Thelephora ganbajun]
MCCLLLLWGSIILDGLLVSCTKAESKSIAPAAYHQPQIRRTDSSPATAHWVMQSLDPIQSVSSPVLRYSAYIVRYFGQIASAHGTKTKGSSSSCGSVSPRARVDVVAWTTATSWSNWTSFTVRCHPKSTDIV